MKALMLLGCFLFVLGVIRWATTPFDSDRGEAVESKGLSWVGGPETAAGEGPRNPSPAATRRATRHRHTEPPSRLDMLDWHGLRQCESSGNYKADTGNGYYGAYQFNLSTWRSVGGKGNPAHATPAEQDKRAKLLYTRRGAQPWPTCGRHLQ